MTTEEELGKALKEEQDTIEIEGDLAKKVIKIKAKGKVAWAVAFGAIAIAVASILATVSTGGASAPATAPSSLIAGTAAASVLGLPTAVTAVSIAVAAGGVASLNKLRKYKVVEQSTQKLILKK